MFRVSFDQSLWRVLTRALLKLLLLVRKVGGMSVATLCTPKRLLAPTPAYGEWLPLLWGSAAPLPSLISPALCLWSPGED